MLVWPSEFKLSFISLPVLITTQLGGQKLLEANLCMYTYWVIVAVYPGLGIVPGS